MPNEPGAVRLLERPLPPGRVWAASRTVRLGDVDQSGQLRLDSTARFLQDVATDDANDAGLDRSFGWLVRRTVIEIKQPARLGESIEVATWCTGIGRSWAERRSQLSGTNGALIDAVSLWVQIAIETGKPARIGPDFLRAYEAVAAGRSVSAQRVLPKPPARPVRTFAWKIRRTDIDPFGHVNNASTWSFVEECCAFDHPSDRVGRAELEYLAPLEHGRSTEVVVDASGSEFGGSAIDSWVVQDGEICAVARWVPAKPEVA